MIGWCIDGERKTMHLYLFPGCVAGKVFLKNHQRILTVFSSPGILAFVAPSPN